MDGIVLCGGPPGVTTPLGTTPGGGGPGLDTGESPEKGDGFWPKGGGLLGPPKGGTGAFCGRLSCKFWKFCDNEASGPLGKLGI